jgi:hypothetical protein
MPHDGAAKFSTKALRFDRNLLVRDHLDSHLLYRLHQWMDGPSSAAYKTLSARRPTFAMTPEQKHIALYTTIFHDG